MGGALQAIQMRRFQQVPQGAASEPTGPVVLAGRRVELRQLGLGDFEAWRRFRADNAAAKEATEPAWPKDLADPAASPEAFGTMIERFDAAAADGLHFAFGVHAGKDLIGEAQLAGIAISGPLSAHFGLFLGQQHVGKQLSQEIFVLLCRFAFDELQLHRVELAVLPSDKAARRAAVKAGLRSEGVAVRFLQIGDEWRDHERFVITAEEWTARRAELEDSFLK